ncbi:hypothetical protein PG990_011795 [Apiospora arundinis]
MGPPEMNHCCCSRLPARFYKFYKRSSSPFVFKRRPSSFIHPGVIQFVTASVDRIEKKADHFEVQDSKGETKKFRKLILAAGSSTIYPQIEGYDKLWKKRIFHCFICQGYEDRGGPSSGVLGVGPVGGALAAHMAQNAAQFTDKVTLYSNGNDAMTAEFKAAVGGLIPNRFSVEARKIRQLTGNDADSSVTVEFEDGTTKVESFLVNQSIRTLRGPAGVGNHPRG